MNSDTPITPDDPRLTAFVLGELEGAERDAVASAVAADPALLRAVEQLRADLGEVQAQLHAAESGQLEFSNLLATQVYERLDLEASDRALDDSIAARALTMEPDPARKPEQMPLPRSTAANSADWRHGLGRDARRRVVWWSPFALPFAASFVAVASVGLLWWNGHAPTLEGDFTGKAVPMQMRLMSAEPAPVALQSFGTSVATISVPTPAPAAAVLAPEAGDSVSESGAVVRDTALALRQDAVPIAGARGLPQAAERGKVVQSPGASLAGSGLFAPRVWAYLPTGAAVRESALPAQGGAYYTPAAGALLAATLPAQEQAVAANELTDAAPVEASPAAVAHPSSLAIAAAPSIPAADYSVATAVPLPVPQPLAGAPASTSVAAAWRSADAPTVSTASFARAPASVQSTVAKVAATERSAQVLAEAATLVRPVAADADAMEGVGVAVAAEPAAAVATNAVAHAAKASVPTAGVLSSSAVATGARGGVGQSATAAVEFPADVDADSEEIATAEAARLTAAQIAAVAAAKHFSQASLAELEAAAFTQGGNVWLAGSDEIVAAAAQVAKAEVAGQSAAQPQEAPVAVPSVPRQNLSSRYVQMKLWVEAGQLPPPSAIDVDAIVRDAVPVYAATALRQIRAQAARANAAVGGASPVPEAVIGTSASADALSAKELEALESRSLMLRLVRSYATLLKDRPADAIAQLDALADQIRQRPRMALGRYGQEFLKLLEATRPLL